MILYLIYGFGMDHKNAVNIAPGLAMLISGFHSMGFENMYENSEHKISPGCRVKYFRRSMLKTV
jgi:hypothetical protein